MCNADVKVSLVYADAELRTVPATFVRKKANEADNEMDMFKLFQVRTQSAHYYHHHSTTGTTRLAPPRMPRRHGHLD